MFDHGAEIKLKKKRFYLFLERWEGRERGRETLCVRDTSSGRLSHQTGVAMVRLLVLNPLSHSSQGLFFFSATGPLGVWVPVGGSSQVGHPLGFLRGPTPPPKPPSQTLFWKKDFSLKKEGNSDSCYSIDEPGRCYAEWNEPVTKGFML